MSWIDRPRLFKTAAVHGSRRQPPVPVRRHTIDQASTHPAAARRSFELRPHRRHHGSLPLLQEDHTSVLCSSATQRTRDRIAAVLQLRPNCECCDRDLPPDSTEALICSFECTFCQRCGWEILGGRCPNCGGELVRRPIRPSGMLAQAPASTERVHHPGGCTAAR